MASMSALNLHYAQFVPLAHGHGLSIAMRIGIGIGLVLVKY